MGCLLAFLLLFFGIIWFLILRYIGFTPPENGCWLGCEFPEDYAINWFGEIWIWSPVWGIVLLFIYLYLREWLKDITYSQFQGMLLSSQKKIVWGLLICIFIISGTILTNFSTDYFSNEIKQIESYSDQVLKEQLGQEISAVTDVETDFLNKSIDVYFSKKLNEIDRIDQFIILNHIREKYILAIKAKGYWKNVNKEKVTVNARTTGYGTFSSLEGQSLFINYYLVFDGKSLNEDDKSPFNSIRNLNSLKNEIHVNNEENFTDSSCNDSRGLAKSMCKEQLKIDYCGQYMGSYMKDGKMVNWGGKQNTYELEKCIQENISP